VDAETESKIQQAMANVVRGRTTFIIAHRLTSIQHATLIVVLDRGHVVEMGTPQQLLANEGFYRHTAELQNAAALPSLPAGAGTSVDARGGAN
jgi:ATP-binding cassette subfamily B protein